MCARARARGCARVHYAHAIVTFPEGGPIENKECVRRLPRNNKNVCLIRPTVGAGPQAVRHACTRVCFCARVRCTRTHVCVCMCMCVPVMFQHMFMQAPPFRSVASWLPIPCFPNERPH